MCERLPERMTPVAEYKYDLAQICYFKLVINLCINYLVWNHITFSTYSVPVTLSQNHLFFFLSFIHSSIRYFIPLIHFMMHAFRFESVTCDARMFFKVVMYIFFRVYWLIPCALLVFGTWSKPNLQLQQQPESSTKCSLTIS